MNTVFSKCSDILLFLQDWMKCLQTFCSNLRKTTQPTSNKRLRQVRVLSVDVCVIADILKQLIIDKLRRKVFFHQVSDHEQRVLLKSKFDEYN